MLHNIIIMLLLGNNSSMLCCLFFQPLPNEQRGQHVNSETLLYRHREAIRPEISEHTVRFKGFFNAVFYKAYEKTEE